MTLEICGFIYLKVKTLITFIRTEIVTKIYVNKTVYGVWCGSVVDCSH